MRYAVQISASQSAGYIDSAQFGVKPLPLNLNYNTIAPVKTRYATLCDGTGSSLHVSVTADGGSTLDTPLVAKGAGVNGTFLRLQNQSNGGMTWALGSTGSAASISPAGSLLFFRVDDGIAAFEVGRLAAPTGIDRDQGLVPVSGRADQLRQRQYLDAVCDRRRAPRLAPEQ